MRVTKGDLVIESDGDFSERITIVETHDVPNGKITTDVFVTRPPSIARILIYTLISLLFLAVAVAAGWWALEGAARLGPQFGYAFYIAVVILGVSVAIALFGIIESFALVTGTQQSINVRLGGPAALFVLVVVGGFLFSPPPKTFSLAVRFANEPDPRALQGLSVVIDLGPRRDTREFTSSGEAVIPDVPTAFEGKDVRVRLSPDRVHLKSNTVRITAEHAIYLERTADPAPPAH
jgi:hypothetical protein